MNQLAGAPVAMHKKGLSTDSAILKAIVRKPGATVAEIAHDLEWTNGKVDGGINRLAAEGKVYIKHQVRRGMMVKKIYSKNFTEKTASQIEIPQEITNLDAWTEKAFVYALSRSTIGVAPRKIDDWDAKAFAETAVSIGKTRHGAVLELPQRFAQFYQMENSEVSLSAVGDLVFVTVESILPIEL